MSRRPNTAPAAFHPAEDFCTTEGMDYTRFGDENEHLRVAIESRCQRFSVNLHHIPQVPGIMLRVPLPVVMKDVSVQLGRGDAQSTA